MHLKLLMMFETYKHVPKTEKHYCVLKDNYSNYFHVNMFDSKKVWRAKRQLRQFLC